MTTGTRGGASGRYTSARNTGPSAIGIGTSRSMIMPSGEGEAAPGALDMEFPSRRPPLPGENHA
ncbi:hypothetical protein [Pseudonocardia acidicola]|uniref:Uncharacterized protein n=1 Tax=Pseudonocardia acidicola TaxID=2724939 RepID=A0ABX1SHD5_9PSEU|nr:hypothetical protein [Pseudonocardia acidicola]NMI00990.1 hypothetical protein [Pseudonocardia acidicola]